MKKFWTKNKYTIILILIIAAGCFLRLYDLNWDQNQHLHPDERFLTMVTQGIKWPSNIFEYFSTNTSPLNPHNASYGFFVYGTFPIFFTKLISQLFGFVDYNDMTLFGRFLSGIIDTLVIIFLFLIGKKIFSQKVGIIASFIYAISVLPIQLSHFYATDTYCNFFIIFSLYLFVNFFYSDHKLWLALAGITFGLAMASKISALASIPIFTIPLLFLLFKKKYRTLISIALFCICAFISFRIFQPYAFSGPTFFNLGINHKFIDNLNELKGLCQPGAYYPPSVQWSNTIPILYPLKNLILYGQGLPLGIISLLSILFAIFIFFKRKYLKKIFSLTNSNIFAITITITAIIIFFYQGIQFVKPMRYFITIYPLLSLLSGYFLVKVFNVAQASFFKKKYFIWFYLILAISLIWPFAFFSIYTKPHSRIQASRWIYKNIPSGSTLGVEHWDDALPLSLEQDKNYTLYKFEELPMFDEDSGQKWTILQEKFKKIDYIVITSNRVYGSVIKMPERYPKTISHYKNLFANKLNFKKVAEFTSRPSLGNFEFIDDNADEVFTVYDHPKVTIFKKNEK